MLCYHSGTWLAMGRCCAGTALVRMERRRGDAVGPLCRSRARQVSGARGGGCHIAGAHLTWLLGGHTASTVSSATSRTTRVCIWLRWQRSCATAPLTPGSSTPPSKTPPPPCPSTALAPQGVLCGAAQRGVPPAPRSRYWEGMRTRGARVPTPSHSATAASTP